MVVLSVLIFEADPNVLQYKRLYVRYVVDLCAAPGSWSQVIDDVLRSDSKKKKKSVKELYNVNEQPKSTWEYCWADDDNDRE